jgi:hypothetical protein
MLSEIQAWEILKEGFSKPEQAFSHNGYAIINDRAIECLCDGLMYLQRYDYVINEVTADSMRKKLKPLRSRNN